MRYRRLGRTDLEVSVVGVGTWHFGGEWGKDFTAEEVARILGSAQDRGVNLVDTAECYGDHLAEALVGRALGSARDDWVVATKFGHRYHGQQRRTEEWSPGEVVRQLERSLRALRTDYVDLYQFHSGHDAAFDRDDLWEALAAQVVAGKVRHLGVSLGPGVRHQVERAVDVGASVVQVVYSRLDADPEAEVFPWCQTHGLGVLARGALAEGLLTGSGDSDHRSTGPRPARSPEEAERRVQASDRVRRQEVPAGTDVATWALAWCLAHPAVTAVLPGCTSVDQVESAAAAADVLVARDA